MPELTLYYREGCHLCDHMLAALAPLQAELGFTVRQRDIDGNAALRERFNEKVPVLALEDEIICCHFLDEKGLRDTLKS
ncbi:MAG: glutaredoxin family protein [Gammaproteobacteria bacterium]|jgi:glutathione S-transferase